MRYGTNHFVSAVAAIRYYAEQGIHESEVGRKLLDGEIMLGPPTFRPGQRCSVIPGEGRYQIEERLP